MRPILGDEILYYDGKLCRINGFTEGGRVVFLEVILDDDKDKCPYCNHPQPTKVSVKEGCPNWMNGISAVKTIEESNL